MLQGKKSSSETRNRPSGSIICALSKAPVLYLTNGEHLFFWFYKETSVPSKN